MSVWEAVDRELEQLRAPLPLWWRDDDAVAATPELETLKTCAALFNAPLALAVIPSALEPSLAEAIKHPSLNVLVHGWRHANHAPPQEKKAEFRAHRPLAERTEETAAGLAALSAAFPSQTAPIFVPPWNRIAPDMRAPLWKQGYRALSTYGPRRLPPPASDGAPELLDVNTHIDPIDWRGTRSAVALEKLAADLAALLTARRLGTADPTEPIGVLTHHLVHDQRIWETVKRLLDHLCDKGRCRWVNVAELPMSNGK